MLLLRNIFQQDMLDKTKHQLPNMFQQHTFQLEL